jgi:hypothetical protein
MGSDWSLQESSRLSYALCDGDPCEDSKSGNTTQVLCVEFGNFPRRRKQFLNAAKFSVDICHHEFAEGEVVHSSQNFLYNCYPKPKRRCLELANLPKGRFGGAERRTGLRERYFFFWSLIEI